MRIKPLLFLCLLLLIFLFKWLSVIIDTFEYHYYRTGWKEVLREGEDYGMVETLKENKAT